MKPNKVIIITGTTASGKTRFSIPVAKKFNLDIINGDSVQIYKDLNIGSAKITEKEKEGVKHYLLDIKNPGESYSVADFQKDARQIIDQNPVNLIVGGTGLYLKALVTNYEFLNEKRDSHFDEKYKDKTNEELYSLLLSYDPSVKDTIHPNNRKRVLRALEVSMNSEVKFSERNKKEEYLYDTCCIVLTRERELLYEDINQRVIKMIQEGLEEEARSFYEKGIYIDAIGYKEWNGYFQGILTKDDVISQIQQNTRHLAKKQITFFKHQFNPESTHFVEVDPSNLEQTENEINQIVSDFICEKECL